MAVIYGVGAVLLAGVVFALFLHTRFEWLAVAFMTPLLAAGLFYVAIRARRVRMVLEEAGGLTMIDLFGGRYSCRAQDLAAIRLVPGYRTQYWDFVRRDGSVAFEAIAAAWPRSVIEAIARRLSVPLQLTLADQVPTYSCPVCGYPKLAEPPARDGVASHEICPSCGFEFGETDVVEGRTYAQWRQAWIDAGMPWFARQAGGDPPQGWDPRAQLKSVQN